MLRSQEYDNMRNVSIEQRKMLLRGVQERAKRSLWGKGRRVYLDSKGNLLSSPLELAVANILHFAGVEYSYKSPVSKGKKRFTPAFTTANGFVIVDDNGKGERTADELRRAFPRKQVLHVTRAIKGSLLSELGSPVASFSVDAETDTDKLESIFVDDPSFAFDYSHILPRTRKCSVLHGHTSSVMVELIGQLKNGMIVDFGKVKEIVRDALRQMDHKLFISSKYLVSEDGKTYRIRFDGPDGEFDLKVPKTSTFFLDGEATIENLADAVLGLLAPRMPRHVQGIGVYIYEGLNKGSHILASLAKESR